MNQLRACIMRPERSRGIQISGSDMSSATPAPIQAFWWKSFCLSGRRTLRSSPCCQCGLRDMQRTPELQCLFIHRSVEQSLQQRLYRDADVDRSVLTVPTSESAFSRVVFITAVSFSRAIRCEFFEALKKAYASWGRSTLNSQCLAEFDIFPPQHRGWGGACYP